MKRLIRLILTGDPIARFEILRRVGKVLVPKYRFKWPQMDWWNDSVFNEYLAKFNATNRVNTDRRWMLYQLMRLVKNVPGDTAECGVYQGESSYIMCRVNEENELFQGTHYVFDSFEGLSAPSERDGTHWKEGDLSCNLEIVSERLSEFNNVSFHKGWIPERFQDVEHRSFCFVHIDVDLYRPTLDSIEFFYYRVNEGGLIVCDDYGFDTCSGATRAIDEFLQSKRERMISLSGGGGFLIKGIETSEPLRLPRKSNL